MLKIILYVVSLAALVTISVWFADEPGRVTLEWLGFRIETSVAMLFVMMATLLVVGTFLVRVWGTLVGAGRAYRDARKDKLTDRGLKSLAAGFAAVVGATSVQRLLNEFETAAKSQDTDTCQRLPDEVQELIQNSKSMLSDRLGSL